MIDLERLKPLVEIMAAERTKEAPHLFDDAVQEGLIAAWTASEKFPGREPRYYHAAARYGVLGVVQGRSLTGEEGRRGWQDAHDSSGPLVVETDGVEHFVAEPVDPRADTELGTAEVRDEIWAAIESLVGLDQALVFGRYWYDLGFADLARILNRPAGTLSRRWTQIIRPALRARLEGLS